MKILTLSMFGFLALALTPFGANADDANTITEKLPHATDNADLPSDSGMDMGKFQGKTETDNVVDTFTKLHTQGMEELSGSQGDRNGPGSNNGQGDDSGGDNDPGSGGDPGAPNS